MCFLWLHKARGRTANPADESSLFKRSGYLNLNSEVRSYRLLMNRGISRDPADGRGAGCIARVHRSMRSFGCWSLCRSRGNRRLRYFWFLPRLRLPPLRHRDHPARALAFSGHPKLRSDLCQRTPAGPSVARLVSMPVCAASRQNLVRNAG